MKWHAMKKSTHTKNIHENKKQLGRIKPGPTLILITFQLLTCTIMDNTGKKIK